MTTPIRPFSAYISNSTFAMTSDISKTNSHWLMKFGQLVQLDESYRRHSKWLIRDIRGQRSSFDLDYLRSG
jgi:hypothetical protein